MFLTDSVTVPASSARCASALRTILDIDDHQSLAVAAHEAQTPMVWRAGVGPFVRDIRLERLPDYRRDEVMVFPIRWSVTGRAGGWFPVLDANLELSPEAAQQCRLSLIGTYRPPGGLLGEAADAVLMNRVARQTAHRFLRDLGERVAARTSGSVFP